MPVFTLTTCRPNNKTKNKHVHKILISSFSFFFLSRQSSHSPLAGPTTILKQSCSRNLRFLIFFSRVSFFFSRVSLPTHHLPAWCGSTTSEWVFEWPCPCPPPPPPPRTTRLVCSVRRSCCAAWSWGGRGREMCSFG